MLNKKLVATLLVGCFGFATAQADNVTVNFTGQVVGSVCTLTSSATNVDLGVIKDTQDYTAATNFTVSLVNCGQGVKKAHVTLTPSSSFDDNDLKARVGNEGNQGNANIAFYTDANCNDKLVLLNGLDFNASSAGTDLWTMNDSTKNIWVRLEKAQDPKVGTISESIVFTAEYE